MIRIGFFEKFKGDDTLLIDVDQEGLPVFVAWLEGATSTGRAVPIIECPGSVVQPGLRVDVVRAVKDTGMVRTRGTEFVWRRSEEGWLEVVEKLAVMKGACHQFLDAPRDDVQVMASTGEYGEAWWRDNG